MGQHSEQDLQYAAEFREGVHREALERIQKLHPEITSVVDRWPVEAYFQEHWDYPGKWYTIVAIPEGVGNRKALVDAIVSDTLKQYGISAGERKVYRVNTKKLDARRYDYEKLFFVPDRLRQKPRPLRRDPGVDDGLNSRSLSLTYCKNPDTHRHTRTPETAA